MNFWFIGVKGVQVEELWSLDAEQFKKLKYVCFLIHLYCVNCYLQMVYYLFILVHHISCSLCLCRPIHGLIFLFKWVQDDEPTGSIVQDTRLDKIFFAKQVRWFNGSFLIPHLLWKQDINEHVHKTHSWYLSWTMLIQFIPHFIVIILILFSHLCLGLPNFLRFYVHFSSYPCVLHPCSSNANHPDNIKWSVQIMKMLLCSFLQPFVVLLSPSEIQISPSVSCS